LGSQGFCPQDNTYLTERNGRPTTLEIWIRRNFGFPIFTFPDPWLLLLLFFFIFTFFVPALFEEMIFSRGPFAKRRPYSQIWKSIAGFFFVGMILGCFPFLLRFFAFLPESTIKRPY